MKPNQTKPKFLHIFEIPFLYFYPIIYYFLLSFQYMGVKIWEGGVGGSNIPDNFCENHKEHLDTR